jgi:GNAT superfamily N-acetyltransferase
MARSSARSCSHDDQSPSPGRVSWTTSAEPSHHRSSGLHPSVGRCDPMNRIAATGPPTGCRSVLTAPLCECGYTGTDQAAFVELFSAWVIEHLSTHLPFLAEVDDQVVGMAWLMVADRVPSPARRRRRTGDVQSVYVVPEFRDGGVGAAPLDAVLAEARRFGLKHVTVHSSRRAVPFYQRTGFHQGQHWLEWRPE